MDIEAAATVLWNETLIINATTGNATNNPADEYECRLFRLLLYTVAMGLLCLVGLVGNTISFLVLNKDKSTPVASFLLQSIAVADNAFLVLWLIHYSVRDVLSFLQVVQSNYPVWTYIRVYTFPILYMGPDADHLADSGHSTEPLHGRVPAVPRAPHVHHQQRVQGGDCGDHFLHSLQHPSFL